MKTIHSHPNPDPTDEFVPLGTIEERIPQIDRDELDRGPLMFVGGDGFEARVPREVLERMVQYGRRSDPNEWFAVLVGRVGEDGRGRYVALLGAVLDDGAVARPGYVETSPDSEARTRNLARTLYPDCSIVGWAHGHVRIGARFSAKDRENQRSWTRPHSLGIVVDPWATEWVGVYRGPGAEKLRSVSNCDGVSKAAVSPTPAGPTPVRDSNPRAEGPVRVCFIEDVGAIIATLLLSVLIAVSAVVSLRAYQEAGAATANVSALSARIDLIEEDRASRATDRAAGPDGGTALESHLDLDRSSDGEAEDSITDTDVAEGGVGTYSAVEAAPPPRRMRRPPRHPKPSPEAGTDAAPDSGDTDAGSHEGVSPADAALDSHLNARP